MVEGTAERFDVTGGSLSFLELGDPHGPVVVALSGLSDGLAPITDPRARAAVPQLPRPLRRFRFVVVSYRDELPPAPSTEQLSDDVAELIEGRFAPPVALTGHSMGGMVAQHLAARRPALVDRLVLSATAGRAVAELRTVLDRWAALVNAGRWRDFYRDAIRTSFTGTEQLRRRLLLRLGPAPRPTERVHRHLALTAACRDHDAVGDLGRIRCPVLVLAGSRDPVVPPAASRDLARAIPGARFELFDGLAHGFPEQVWRRYVDMLVGFLTSERTGA